MAHAGLRPSACFTRTMHRALSHLVIFAASVLSGNPHSQGSSSLAPARHRAAPFTPDYKLLLATESPVGFVQRSSKSRVTQTRRTHLQRADLLDLSLGAFVIG